MGEEAIAAKKSAHRAWSRTDIACAVGLFTVAVLLVAAALIWLDPNAISRAPGTALFFLAYALFTISIGYEHPNIGYYSFDRVAQVASILVLGPVGAAVVNGFASLIYPWHRVLNGVPVRNALFASLYNSGLMATIILLSGLAYEAVGGPIPLTDLGGLTPIFLVGLVLAMQFMNDLGMLAMLVVGRHKLTGFFEPFPITLELGAGAVAVLVALVFNSMSLGAFVLLLLVLSLGMLALRQFARMRQKLEEVVAERTRSLEEKTRELEQMAIRDNLTGLFNRRHAEAFLERQLTNGRRYGRSSSVALADIDRFKQINDGYSHAMGDQVLKHVAAMLTARCRKSDMIARYGGEEFLICFPETGIEQANAICETLRAAVAGHDWRAIGLKLPVTISFGVAESRDELGAEALVEEADVRLYEAKNAGRNRVVA